MVLERGLDFTSPFGVIVDAILFPSIATFSFYLALVTWRSRHLLTIIKYSNETFTVGIFVR